MTCSRTMDRRTSAAGDGCIAASHVGKVSDWTIEQRRQIAANAVTGDQRKMTVKNAERGGMSNDRNDCRW